MFALLVARWTYGIEFHIQASIPPVALTVLTAASIGFATAHAIERPEITALLT